MPYGIERNSELFSMISEFISLNLLGLQMARWGIEQDFDIIFIGWMDPGVDFRDAIQTKTDVVITTSSRIEAASRNSMVMGISGLHIGVLHPGRTSILR